MVSVFYNPTYHHMVILNNMLKLYSVPNEQMATHAPNLQMAEVRKCDSGKRTRSHAPHKKMLFAWPSPRYLSEMADDLMRPSSPCSHRQPARPDESLSVLMQNQTAFTQLNPAIVPRQRIHIEPKFSHRNFSSETNRLPLNRQTNVLKSSPHSDPRIEHQTTGRELSQLRSRRSTRTTLSDINLQECLQSFLNSIQCLTNIVLNIEPIQHLTCAFNFLNAIFEYFSITIANVFSNQVLPVFRHFVVDPLADHISRHFGQLCECLERNRFINRAFGNEVESKQNPLLYILTMPCQSSLSALYAGQYPSLADALPSKPILPQRSKDRLQTDCSFRQLLLLGII
ncbi:hypothetical protein AWZ03_007558 [Drosophila navojoa]|uniref:Uncharacterized protein n=1 Tax=Drosophila navojoa TaxID=7232 RepID=A0A484BB01_DRONA|nr:hypothetical protein AWZ03_007558 [Drosophila navojoa]